VPRIGYLIQKFYGETIEEKELAKFRLVGFSNWYSNESDYWMSFSQQKKIQKLAEENGFRNLYLRIEDRDHKINIIFGDTISSYVSWKK
jgi:hypothetical protein